MVHFIIGPNQSPLSIPVGEAGMGGDGAVASMTVSVDPPVDSLLRVCLETFSGLSSESGALCSLVSLFSSYWVTASCLTSLFLFKVRFWLSTTDIFLLRLSSESLIFPNFVSFSMVQLLFSNMTALLLSYIFMFSWWVCCEYLRVSSCTETWLGGERGHWVMSASSSVTRARPWISKRPLRQTSIKLVNNHTHSISRLYSAFIKLTKLEN